MPAALDDIRFLSDSDHRVVVLEELLDGPRTQAELRTATGASSATISRLLRSFGERQWVGRHETGYTLTALGRFTAVRFVRFHDEIKAAEQLCDILDYLPVDEFDFDLTHLRDARITRPTRTDTIAPIRREVDLMVSCTERFQMLVTAVDRLATQEVARLVRQVPVFEGVYTREAYETVVSDDAMRADLDAYMRAGGTLYLYSGDTSMVTVGLNDDVVGLELNDGHGFVPAFVESDDDAVLAWAARTYNEFKQASEPLPVDAFAG